MRDRTECRECGQPLAGLFEMQSGWCLPCCSWEFRHDERDDEPDGDLAE